MGFSFFVVVGVSFLFVLKIFLVLLFGGFVLLFWGDFGVLLLRLFLPCKKMGSVGSIIFNSFKVQGLEVKTEGKQLYFSLLDNESEKMKTQIKQMMDVSRVCCTMYVINATT